MDYPKHPDDQELKNIIDKLAQFVARNGYDFEQMTKQKQRDNPKFSFLFGGEFFNYYQFKVNTEQAILRQQMSNQEQQITGQFHLPPSHMVLHQQPNQQQNTHPQATNFLANHIIQMNSNNQMQMPLAIFQQPPTSIQQPTTLTASLPPNVPSTLSTSSLPSLHIPPSSTINSVQSTQQQQNEIILKQIKEAQDQIRQSEQNLMAQHQVMMKQQQHAIEEAINKSQDENLRLLTQEYNFNLNEFDNVLPPIVETCTKESISVGKNLIFNRCSLPVHFNIISQYLLKRIQAPNQTFESKLHILYLINDLLNHCSRKANDALKRSLKSVIVPIYCITFFESDEEKQQRLLKLLKLWETNQYIDEIILDQLQKPQMAMATYQANLCNENNSFITPITTNTNNKYSLLQKQHNEFVAHQNNKIQQLQHQLSSLSTSVSTSGSMIIQNQPPMQNFVQRINSPLRASFGPPMFSNTNNQSIVSTSTGPIMSIPVMPPQRHMIAHQLQTILPNENQHPIQHAPFVIPPGQILPNSSIQATSVPNPHFFSTGTNVLPQPSMQIPMIIQEPIIPDVPYYELPAGLMVPLVKLEDFEYQSINSKNIRLPPPTPPSERLLKSVEAFYAAPSHEHPRNSDGWEQLSLYEFFRAKSQARKVIDDNEEFKEQSSPIKSEDLKETEKQKSKENEHNNSPHCSTKKERSRSRSKSPRRKYNENKSTNKRKRYRSSSSSRSASGSSSSRSSSRSSNSSSSSSSPHRRNKNSRRRNHSRSRSRSPSYRKRDISPLYNASFNERENRKLDESNKGHQLLKKMGWSGSGLGASEQGICDPIKGGEIRDGDYRGIGVESVDINDPYESFRKSKGKAFMHRVMKGRTEKK